jgi:hypothetical protein
MAHPAVTTVAFAKQRTTVAGLARKQYPTYAASIARQTKSGRGAGFTHATVIGHTVTTPKPTAPSTHPAPATVWGRFGKPSTRAAYVAPKSRIVTDGTHTYVAPHATTHTYVAPHATTHTYTAPVHTYAAPVTHTYTAPVHTYVAPVTHTYVAPVHPATVQHVVTPPVHVNPPPHGPAPAPHGPGA